MAAMNMRARPHVHAAAHDKDKHMYFLMASDHGMVHTHVGCVQATIVKTYDGEDAMSHTHVNETYTIIIW